MAFKSPTSKQFIQEFYNLFSEWQDDSFIGSKEQIRLLLQLKLQCFIPQTYIDTAIKSFINSKTVSILDRSVEIERQIGKKYFKNTPQRVYQKRKELVTQEELEKLEFIFQNFSDVVLELTKEKDIIELRYLEKEKNVKIDALVVIDRFGRSKYRNKNTRNDWFWLYDVPRKEVLENIKILKEYDPERAEIEKNEFIRKSQEEKSKKEEAYDKVFSMGAKLLEKSLIISSARDIEVIIILPYGSNQILGSMSPLEVEWKDSGMLRLFGTELNIELPIFDFRLVPEKLEMTLTSISLKLKFKIDETLTTDMEMLNAFKEKIDSLYMDY